MISMIKSNYGPDFTQNAENLLKNYILKPDIPIHNADPDVLSRKPLEDRIYYLPDCPASTTLIPKRNFLTGEVLNFVEAEIQDAGANQKNSMSLTRAPGPLEESVRGSAINYPFWPGGFEQTENEIKSLLCSSTIKFDNILTCPPGFTHGKDFGESKVLKKKNTLNLKTVNLLEALETEIEIQEWFKNNQNDDKESNQVRESENNNIINDDIISNDFVPILEISKTKVTNKTKLEWAEMLDISAPITDFEKRLPQPAMRYEFELDNFQKVAILKLEEGQNVFVAAHTSAGKTVVAEYAIAISQKHMTKAVYTSPIKALSNQKYREFKKKFDDVGLITGDIQIDPTASCLIMTTEILRSMLFCGSDNTRDIEYVIFDEVHYINDEDRGHVWEEVLILLPDHVNIIMLSATVPNTLEFADWVGRTKKRKVFVISTLKRPIPLKHFLYTGCGGKSKNDIFLVVDENGNFINDNYEKAVEKKTTTNTIIRNYEKYDKTLWTGLIDYLKRNDKLPVVAFTLSRKRCDSNAAALKSCNLLTATESCLAGSIFQQCLQKLKPPDRIIPQVLIIRDCVERGFGIHHSGILPILKEIVEILFQRGFVKILFATETFAMGVNMPARTVLFDSHIKYDGSGQRFLEPAEYIQMAGRAGRRGHDENGTVILICKQKIPSNVDLRKLMLGSPMKLQSRFVLRYAMILACLRVESIKVEDMLTHSFMEYFTIQKMPEREKLLNMIEKKLEALKPMDSKLDIFLKFYDLANDYFKEIQNFWEIAECQGTLKQIMYKHLKPGKVVIISYKNHYNKLAIILSAKQMVFEVMVLVNNFSQPPKITLNLNQKQTEKDDMWYKMVSLTPQHQFFVPSTIGAYAILKIGLFDIKELTKASITVNVESINIDWVQRNHFKKNFTSDPAARKVTMELHKLNEKYISNPNSLSSSKLYDHNPIYNCKIKALEEDLKKILPYINIANFEDEFEKVYERKTLEKQKEDQKNLDSIENSYLYKEYCDKLEVLKEFKYIDEQNEVQVKGRIACEMRQNELLITELVLRNTFEDLTPPEIAALLSGLVFQAKTEVTPTCSNKLKECMEKFNEIDTQITLCEKKYKVMQTESKSRLNFGLIQVVYEWAKEKPFADIMQLTDIQEGIIVRCIQQLDETLRDVKTAAIRIGNPTLESKMEEASNAIKRDIVFAASLYTRNI